MSKLLNILQTDDPFYRYKMPPVLIQSTRKHTEITNLESIAKSLDRPAKLLLKYITIQLGTFATKNAINGIHQRDVLQKVVYKFISSCVLCDTCNNPETDVVIEKKKKVLVCKSCGSKSDIKDEKILKYIV